MNKHWDEAMGPVGPAAPAEREADTTRAPAERIAARELQFRELIKMLRRRIRLILTTTLCGTLAVFALGISIPPKYTAKAQIVIDQGNSQATELMRDETLIESYATMLRSRNHLRRVMDGLRDDPAVDSALRLDEEGYTDPAIMHTLPPSRAQGPLLDPSTLITRLKIWIGGSGDRTRWILNQLERSLWIAHEGRSRILSVSYTWTDPSTAAIVASQVAKIYVETGREQKLADDKAELARLDSRAAELKADIEASTAAVQGLLRQKPDTTRPGEMREAKERLQQLEQDAATKAQLYHTLLQRQRQIRDQLETVTPDARILSLAATPDRPSSPNPLLFIFPAFVLFLIFGSMLAFLLERLDRGLRNEREIEEVLGIPCIGLVPQVAKTERRCPLHQYLVERPYSSYAEALRSIAATLQLTSPCRQPMVVLITSSLPAEGKSTLAVSLSASIAMIERRVLLIDFDFTQASTLLDIKDTAKRGVVDLMLNNAPASEVIQSVPELGIDYLPMNQCSFYPLLRFAAVELPHLIRTLRDSYDCVILNSPPVLGRTETRLLAALADHILFVVKWGRTRREFAQNALSLLRDKPVLSLLPQSQSVSAVITQVDVKQHARYGYGDIGEYFSMDEKLSFRSRDATTATPLLAASAAFLKHKLLNMLARRRRQAASPPASSSNRITRPAATISKATRHLRS